MYKNMSKMPVEKTFISVFASGMSILNLTEQDMVDIHNKSFCIFMNYAPCKIDFYKYMDCLIWSDKRVSEWLNAFYKNKKPEYYLVSREDAFYHRKWEVYHFVDFFFNKHIEEIKGNYTIVWLLQLLEKYFSNKKILIFGHDCDGKQKWYDTIIDYDFVKRTKNYSVPKKVNDADGQLNKFIKNKNIFYNCNLNSKSSIFQKKDFREII